MSIRNKLSLLRWNIGFIESTATDILNTNNQPIHWLKHKYKDRFFADPFILDYDENLIRVLVEEYPFSTKKGIISMLVVDKKTYCLKEKRTIIKQDYHQSYPFILRLDGKIYIIPEASQSGSLWIYEFDGEKITDRKLLIEEPLVDSTIIKHKDMWWLFCTKRGFNPNKDLYIYLSHNPLVGYEAISTKPVKKDPSSSRPAGNMIKFNGNLYRFTQDCSITYGGGITVTKINELTNHNFCENIEKTIDIDLSDFNKGFHTLNEHNGLTVIDGIKSEFRPIKKIFYTLKSKFISH